MSDVCMHGTNFICVPLDGASWECIARSAPAISCFDRTCVWSVLMYTQKQAVFTSGN